MATFEKQLTEAAELLEALNRRNEELVARIRELEAENTQLSGLRQGNRDTRQANEALEKANKLLQDKINRLGADLKRLSEERGIEPVFEAIDKANSGAEAAPKSSKK
ncbi:MAG: hypothetical protein A3J30_01690 [Candidatus Wildermuthbacteria bacterium RIFCSPLOWO2_02_FULL_47_9c]|uniref:Uncharacterized protein n=2 Tax=Parcubacteria group TaxID=1794811 RepID=A0A837IM45_9BACT|nr:MAG: hypothetical protein UY25_C0001G0097 [Candidatus Yanofskybacteria bacterium GW2011_GWC1_48_11]KKW03928.1 MAG: hypothetical protein UY38_C0002G0082 [Parcubacteria group bacterium GW2011_GWB1_49_12]KKW08725.1 MAG: hypothetical protein UY45_C0004G0055 [Parcubacteria group bacterium GW2011_GWA1_49_26]KKW13986.1 MAG: hypothetical protein UY53_C0004G0037 [Parcubacteria group bacterium GW2011_GWA2_50_10]OHA61671.1 MAG: hypothetical protein A2109_02925 [Candidatus Wildermuthbacteria bacterium G